MARWRLKQPANKYGARRTTVDGITFHSKREADHYSFLKNLQSLGLIRNLKLQPRFKLSCGGKPVLYASGRQAVYVADFEYEEAINVFQPKSAWEWRKVITDVKGRDTLAGQLKRAVFEAETGQRVGIVQ